MTTLTLDDVRKNARLARLQLSPEEEARYQSQMSNIINFVEQLKEVDTAAVEPLANVVDIDLFLRDDVVNDGGYQSDILANAPEALEGFFVVQKVVE